MPNEPDTTPRTDDDPDVIQVATDSGIIVSVVAAVWYNLKPASGFIP